MPTSKQQRFEDRTAKRKEEKKPSKAEILLAQGLKYYNFVLPIQLLDVWCQALEDKGIKPNDRLLQLVIRDMKGGE